jgi:hypothetical protein
MILSQIPTAQQFYDELISSISPELETSKIESLLCNLQNESKVGLQKKSSEFQNAFRTFDHLLERRIRTIREEIEAADLAMEREHLNLDSFFQDND